MNPAFIDCGVKTTTLIEPVRIPINIARSFLQFGIFINIVFAVEEHKTSSGLVMIYHNCILDAHRLLNSYFTIELIKAQTFEYLQGDR